MKRIKKSFWEHTQDFFLQRSSLKFIRALAVTIVPIHDFVVLLNFLLYVSKFVLQIFTSLPFLQERWILQPKTDQTTFGILSHKRKYVDTSTTI